MDFTKAIELRKEYIKQQFSHLNEMQQSAVFTIKGPLLILAGAGSGKTSVLINRISNMVRFGDSINSGYFPSDVPREVIGLLECAVSNGEKLDFEIEKLISTGPIRPYNILAITFTNKAANEMRERVDDIVGYGAENIFSAPYPILLLPYLSQFL